MQVCHFQHLLRQLDKNEPSRFLGDGVSFRAKLIGVLEVAEARGDRMCQEALGDLKMAVRAAGEHKQRIQVHVAIDGLRLRDDKTGDSLYHHPVHKISFIAQDMTDSRAFGYIFGSPDTGHRFFGIKTDKAASQVVIAMRDLFQVVFELKKKEIELAKQQLEGKTVVTSSRHNPCLPTETSSTKSIESSSVKLVSEPVAAKVTNASGGVAELVDLEQELSSLRRGLHQVEGLTPADPFGDSFTAAPSVLPTAAGSAQKGLLPPPPSGATTRTRTGAAPATAPPASATPRAAHTFSPSKTSIASAASSGIGFDVPTPPGPVGGDSVNGAQSTGSKVSTEQLLEQPNLTLSFDVFTELDPLGTGRSKPYVDKKHFFQELKNPPKKVLKDLVSITTSLSLLTDPLPGINTTVESTKTETTYTATTITSVGRHSGGSVSIANPAPAAQMFASNQLFSSDPFAETDPFDSTDPFSDSLREDPFANNSSTSEFSLSTFQRDCMAEYSNNLKFSRNEMIQDMKIDENGRVQFFNMNTDTSKRNVFNGPLQVSLPPEQAPKSPRLLRQMTTDTKQSGTVRQRPHFNKQSTMIGANGAPSPPPPLPPKKTPLEMSMIKPPPRPPHSDTEPIDSGTESGPALPNPARRWGVPDRANKPSISSITTNSSGEDEYLTPVPPPILPGSIKRHPPKSTSPGLDITLSQLLTCGLEELAVKLNVPASRLSSMTLVQLTSYLKDFLETGQSTTTTSNISTHRTAPIPKEIVKPPVESTPSFDFKANFEDNFSAANTSDGFVANFENFNKKSESSYDRYAVFREIQEEELKNKSVLDTQNGELNNEENQNNSSQEDMKPNNTEQFDDTQKEVENLLNIPVEAEPTEIIEKITPRKSPMQVLDELTLDSFNVFKSASTSPRPPSVNTLGDESNIKLDLKILQKPEQPVKQTPEPTVASEKMLETKQNNDKYAALRDICIVESPPTVEVEPPAMPPEGPKERKKSDEKSDGFDNSDFFDCIDNSSLSFSHADDAFRKSPIVIKDAGKEKQENKEKAVSKLEVKEEPVTVTSPSPPALLAQTQATMSAGSLSDIMSASSPEAGHKDKLPLRKRAQSPTGGTGWTVFPAGSPRSEEGASPWSSDSKDSDARGSKWGEGKRDRSPPALPRPRRRPQHGGGKAWHARQTSSSSRDASPWEEEPPPPVRPHARSSGHQRDSRHNSSGSRECLDSGSGRDRDKDKLRRDSGSGRDRERRRSRDRDQDLWERDYGSRERDYIREGKGRERGSRERDHGRDRDKERERHRRRHHSWDDDEEYSDGRVSMHSSGGGRRPSPGSRPSSRDHWEVWPPDERTWRRDERNYGTLGWRESRRRAEASRQTEEQMSRYGLTMSTRGRRSAQRNRRTDAEAERRHTRPRPPRSPFDDNFTPPPRYSPSPPHSPRQPRPPPSRNKRADRHYYQDTQPQDSDVPIAPVTKQSSRFRFSNDFSEKESPKSQNSPFENDFVEPPAAMPKKKYSDSSYLNLDKESPMLPRGQGFGSRFKFDNDLSEENLSASPASARYGTRQAHALLQNEDSPTPQTGRFRFDSEAVSPRSMFDDDFGGEPRNGILRTTDTSLARGESIAEEDESGPKDKPADKNVGFATSEKPAQEARKTQPKLKLKTRPDIDIKKSESVNIFVRDTDPFDGDDFFSCTGSDKAGCRENWPGKFTAFDDV